MWKTGEIDHIKMEIERGRKEAKRKGGKQGGREGEDRLKEKKINRKDMQ